MKNLAEKKSFFFHPPRSYVHIYLTFIVHTYSIDINIEENTIKDIF